MALSGSLTYVGFGFGAIQSGLFLYEAWKSEAFGRMVIAEVVPQAVEALRNAGGCFSVNIAHPDHVETASVGPIQIENPGVHADRERLVQAVAEAQEIGTAIPSVRFYVSEGEGSIHRILAAGLRRKAAAGGPRAVVYTAENNNHAAEILEEAVMGEIPEAERAAVRARVCFLNTVVGKMSGILTDPGEVKKHNLATVTPNDTRAFLVERFNRILISKIRFSGEGAGAPFERGIKAFEEKSDLLPFEEAKLYGHNATHALAAYLAMLMGLDTIAELRQRPAVMDFLRAAFIEESGAALIRKYQGLDPLFTGLGYCDYAEDLLGRMTNPWLLDKADRVGRDPERKLSWDDRLVGTMRVALGQGVRPGRYAVGAAAALAALSPDYLAGAVSADSLVEKIWPAETNRDERAQVLTLIEQGRQFLVRWREANDPGLEEYYGKSE